MQEIKVTVRRERLDFSGWVGPGGGLDPRILEVMGGPYISGWSGPDWPRGWGCEGWAFKDKITPKNNNSLCTDYYFFSRKHSQDHLRTKSGKSVNNLHV